MWGIKNIGQKRKSSEIIGNGQKRSEKVGKGWQVM